MIDVIELYKDVSFRINKEENGYLSYDDFNRLSKLAELRLLDYISGDIENQKPPIPFMSQKNRDWLAPFIVPIPKQIEDGIIVRPESYYGFENMFRIGSKEDCEEENDDECNTKIELLAGTEYDERCTTSIEGLNPSMSKPIAKEVGNKFYFTPKTLGSIVLEYIRYPKYAKIATKMDEVYKEEVPDANGTIDYEWNENAREYLIYFIVHGFGVHVREAALLQSNTLINKDQRSER